LSHRIVSFLATLLAGYLCADVVLFRSGFYARYLEPQYSATGSLETTLAMERRRPSSGKREILMVGNSRIAEGFSAKIADQQQPQTGFHFSNFAVPGTGNRVWYYLVRDVDPHRNRYAALAIPLDDYEDPDDYEDVADRVAEMPLLVNRIGLRDIVPYTASFTTWKARLQVLRGLLFPATVYQHDFQDFAEHPARRLERIADYRANAAREIAKYDGMKSSLAGLHVDYAHHSITFPSGMPGNKRQDFTNIFFSRPPQAGRNRAFEVRWLGALVDLYRGSATKIVIYQVPRSPAPKPPLGHLSWTIVDELRKRPWVRVIDRQTFEDLERPELFADHLHLNAEGRKIFSPRLATAITRALCEKEPSE